MEKHISKKLFMSALALSAGFALASCDPVTAVPSNYNEEILVRTEDGQKIEFDDNILGTLYDSIASDKNSQVVNKILDSVIEQKFGTFADFYNKVKGVDNNIMEKDYFKYSDVENKVEYDDDAKNHVFTKFKEDIEARISEFFYNEITSGSYNDEDGRFDEQKLYDAHRQELYDLEKVTITNKFYVTKELDKEKILENGFDPMVLKGTYYNLGEGKRGYIEEKVYPEILKNKLVEDYIYHNNASSLGRSYARNISFIKVSYEEDHSKLWSMLKTFAKDYIEAGSDVNFEIITDAVKGFTVFDGTNGLVNNVISSVDAYDVSVTALLGKTYNEKITVTASDDYKYQGKTLIQDGEYYTDTKVGQIIESYVKAIKAEKAGRFPTAEDKAELDKFTADGKSKEYGLMQKLISLAKEDYTTDGWFVKSSGAGDLTSKLSDRLFNIKVANDFNKTAAQLDEKSYIREVGGKKYVLPTDVQTVEENPFNYICQDRSGKAFYICQVEEAVSPAKFNSRSDYYYGTEGYKVEDISRSVAKILGTKDSYIKDAYTEYLNNYDITFYDSSLYDYFKSEYPDLDMFDED